MSRAGGMYRYYTCSNKARQGKTGCEGRSIPIDRLDHLVANHLEERVLQPERLEIILASVLDRRQERTDAAAILLRIWKGRKCGLPRQPNIISSR